MLNITKATGQIEMADGSIIDLGGKPLDILTLDPKNMVSIMEGAISFESPLAHITFTATEQVRVFVAHNQDLALKTSK
ncbi:MAG: hypothetical protein PF503_06360 [Desulfobacula sp.]|jgi:hypothetical protein|nr:hypothetical protein [Desulfobacula sp.]